MRGGNNTAISNRGNALALRVHHHNIGKLATDLFGLKNMVDENFVTADQRIRQGGGEVVRCVAGALGERLLGSRDAAVGKITGQPQLGEQCGHQRNEQHLGAYAGITKAEKAGQFAGRHWDSHIMFEHANDDSMIMHRQKWPMHGLMTGIQVDSQTLCRQHGLGAVVYVECTENCRNVDFDRALGEVERARDHLVLVALYQ
jgi:hypothetical protein